MYSDNFDMATIGASSTDKASADKDTKATITRNGFKFPAPLRGLIEKPPLLEGENSEHFWSFLQAVVEDQKPSGILDWISAIDIATKAWEELRIRRSSIALIHGGMLSALYYFLDAIKPSAMGGVSKSTQDLALKYFSKNPRERKEVITRLAQHGISLPELQAKAIELNGEALQMLERMLTTREKGRRKLRKEVARRQAKRRGDRPNSASDEQG